MAAISALPITEVLGWKATDDKTHVLLGLQQPDGNEIALAIPNAKLLEIIVSLANATEAFVPPKTMNVQDALAMGINWFEFGKDVPSGDFFVRFRLVGGGHLSFVMGSSMAEQLTETLNATVLGVATDLPTGTSKN